MANQERYHYKSKEKRTKDGKRYCEENKKR